MYLRTVLNLREQTMVSQASNEETLQAVSNEIKLVQTKCFDTYNNLISQNIDAIALNTGADKPISYLEGLRLGIVNSATPIPTNSNLITSQFLAEMKERNNQVDELIAFTRASIYEVDNEIERLNNLIKTGKDALSKPQVQKQDVSPQQVKKATETFKLLKNELHSLIQSMFPDTYDLVFDLLGQLMQENLNNGYVPITEDTFSMVQLLKDMKIVTTNPYNNMEVKLAL